MTRVLVVEDDADVREMLGFLLEEEGYQPCFASEARQALRMQESEPADLVVSDFRLPGMNGAELCVELRKRQDKTPVLVLSGDPAFESRTAGIDRCEVLKKPFETEDLLDIIQRLTHRLKGDKIKAV